MKALVFTVSVFTATALAQQPPQEDLFEIRLVASAAAEGTDLEEERRRLEEWLSEGDHREQVRDAPGRIARFNALPPDRGGPLAPELRWRAHVIRPRPGKADQWDRSYARMPGVEAVPLFGPEEYAQGPSGQRRRLVELLPIDGSAGGFTHQDFVTDAFVVWTDAGERGLQWRLRPESRDRYEAWTGQRVGRHLAVLVDGEVATAPRIEGPIVGRGLLVGDYTEAELRELAARLRGEPPPETAAGSGETVVNVAGDGPAPASADPADLRAMQGAEAMLDAERRLAERIRSGEISADRILSFEQIESWPYEDGLLGMPESVKEFDGEQVLMLGFMLPIDEVENIKEFLLVQSLWSCCYGQPPDINGIVRVVMKGDARIDYQFEPIKVLGTFRVEATEEDGYVVDIYQLHADEVSVVE